VRANPADSQTGQAYLFFYVAGGLFPECPIGRELPYNQALSR